MTILQRRYPPSIGDLCIICPKNTGKFWKFVPAPPEMLYFVY